MLHDLVPMGLIVAAILMWQRIADLRARLDALEVPAYAAPWPAPAPAPRAEAPPPPVRAAPVAARVAERVLEPAPAVTVPVASEPVRAAPRAGFEELFGRRLPIWAGGVTLAVAGALIVRFSIDAGLFPPAVRVLCGLAFGSVLIGAAEGAHRATGRVRDPRVAQALAGAGVASLYASILIAANLYQLILPLTAFLGLASVTVAAMGLSLRFGAPCALLGLLGGLAAPALAGGGPADVPLLATYLALVVGGLCALSRRQRWAWLGIAALLGGFGWGGVLIASGALHGVGAGAAGIYLLLLGVGFPLLAAPGVRDHAVRAGSGLVAALEIAALVATGGFDLLNWGLLGLVSLGLVCVALRDPRLAALPALGLGIALALIAAWPQPAAGAFALVMLGTALIYAGPAFVGLWRPAGTIVAAGQIAATAAAGLLLALLHCHHAGDGRALLFGGFALLCAALPAAAAMLGWRSAGRRADARFALLATAAAILVAAAGVLALPVWSVPGWVAAVGLATLLLGHRADDARLEASAWALATAAVLLLALDWRIARELARACGEAQRAEAIAVLRWTALAALLAAFAWRGRARVGVVLAQVGAVLAGYVAIARAVPLVLLPLVPAGGLVLLAGWSRTLAEDRLRPAATSLVGLMLLWAAVPLVDWLAAASGSLVGMPLLATALPDPQACVLRLLLPASALVAALAVARADEATRMVAAGVAALIGAVGAHILYKQLFALGSEAAFVGHGLAERTLWEALLLGGAVLAWRCATPRPWGRRVAIGLGGAALAHAGWYTILLHDPLWVDQAVGAAPMLNWLLPAFGLPLLVLWLAGQVLPARLERPRAIAQMLLILLLGTAELRQAVHGPLLSVPGVTAAEDVLRSVGAIAIAIGFLLWGIRGRARDWRIGSLLLMLAAVAKVFLVDAAGLDGLLRIGAFVALGSSLIGIGWLYSRYLGVETPLTAHA